MPRVVWLHLAAFHCKLGTAARGPAERVTLLQHGSGLPAFANGNRPRIRCKVDCRVMSMAKPLPNAMTKMDD